MSTSITACPNALHVEATGSVTSPVTQVAVVAVNSASEYGTAIPFAELMGSDSNKLPTRIVTKKLNSITCVVDNENFLFFTIDFPLKSIKNQRPLQSAGSFNISYKIS
jgi:hypothetical protein